MPIASGATGRVDVGVDTSKRWAPDGARARPVIRQHDSYLLRYQELKELQQKDNVLKSMPEERDPTDVKNNGVKDEMTQKTNSEDNTSGKASGGNTSKTTKLCVIL